MVTLRGNHKTGIQKTISFDDDGQVSTQLSQLGEQEQRRLRQAFEAAKRDRERIWQSQPTKKRLQKAEQQQSQRQQNQPKLNRPQQQHRPERDHQPPFLEQIPPIDLLAHREQSDQELAAQGLSKRQIQKIRARKAILLELRQRPRVPPAASRTGEAELSKSARRKARKREKQANRASRQAKANHLLNLGASSSSTSQQLSTNVSLNSRGRQVGRVMDDPDESRTTAVGRKRKKGNDLRSQLQADKRRRLSARERSDGDDDWGNDAISISDGSDYVESRESGEVSTSNDDGENDDDDDCERAATSTAPPTSTKPHAAAGTTSRASPIIISDDTRGERDVQMVPPPVRESASGSKQMRLRDLEPISLREHVRLMQDQSSPRLSLEEAVRQIIQSAGQHRSTRAGHFSRSMNWSDLDSKPHLKSHLHTLGTTADDILPSLFTVVNKGAAFHKQARGALLDFFREHFIEPQTNGQTAGVSMSSEQVKRPRTASVQSRHSVVSDAPSVGQDLDVEMDAEVPAPGSENDSDESSDDPSVGDSPAGQTSDYGSVARHAAGFTPLDNRPLPSKLIRIRELAHKDQALQYRYFRLSNLDSLVNCLCCAGPGHMEDDCPESTCVHCGAFKVHFSHNCPKHKKCPRCRKRGHSAETCTRRRVLLGGAGDPCDVCGETGHVEEECEHLWCGREISGKVAVVRMPKKRMIKACYNCGASGHFGGDCPSLADYLKSSQRFREWSDAPATRLVEGAGESPRQSGSNHGHGYQMAHFDDMRDY